MKSYHQAVRRSHSELIKETNSAKAKLVTQREKESSTLLIAESRYGCSSGSSSADVRGRWKTSFELLHLSH